MESYCLKCKKNTENIDPKISSSIMVRQWYYQNMQYVEVENQDLLKIGGYFLLNAIPLKCNFVECINEWNS